MKQPRFTAAQTLRALKEMEVRPTVGVASRLRAGPVWLDRIRAAISDELHELSTAARAGRMPRQRACAAVGNSALVAIMPGGLGKGKSVRLESAPGARIGRVPQTSACQDRAGARQAPRSLSDPYPFLPSHTPIGSSRLLYGQRAQVRRMRGEILRLLVWSRAVVEIEPHAHACLRLGDRAVGVEIDLLILRVPPEPLDKDVVHPAALAVHADAHALGLQDPGELPVGELRPLLGIEDPRRSASGERLVQRLEAEIRRERVGKPPGEHLACLPSP